MDSREAFFSGEYKETEEFKSEVLEDNCLARTLQQLRERYNIAEASYAKNHAVYHYIVIISFDDNSARYEGIEFNLERSFIEEFALGYLFRVISPEKFEREYKNSVDAPIPVIQPDSLVEAQEFNQSNTNKLT